MDRISYKDSNVVFKKINIRSDYEDNVCYCCHNFFKTGEDCVIIINNYKYVPNLIIHKSCMDKHDRLGLLNDIEIDYEKYKNDKLIFG